MGQKVHPYGFRLVSIRKPRSRWFAEGARYREQLIEDIKLREYIHDRQRNAGVSDVIIDRTADTITITIEAARPGIMIGRGGRDVDRLRLQLQKLVDAKVRVNVEETSQPDTCAQLVADGIAWQIERRVSPRRAMGQAMERALEHGAQGVRCEIAGRIGGAEIARREKMGPEGRVPLQSLRADIDFGITEAHTAYGNIGVKVWIYKGDILPPKEEEERDIWEELGEEAARIDHEEQAEEEEGAAAMIGAASAAQPEAEPEAAEVEADEPSAEESVEAVSEDEPAGDGDETEAEAMEVEADEPSAEESVEAVSEDEPAGDDDETKPAVPVEVVEEEVEDVDA